MDTNYILIGAAFFTAAFLVVYVVNRWLLRFAESLGIRNKNDVVVRWNNHSKPSLGGVSLYFVFLVAVFGYAFLFSTLECNPFQEIQFLGLMTAGTLAFAIGIADDAYNTKPLLKLLGQIACGIILVFTDNSIDLFHLPIVDGILTVFWIVAIMNSLNMLDNMDGISGTVSFSILLSCLVLLSFVENSNSFLWTLIIIAEMGGLVAFLRYNIYPAKLFMGDSGSQFLALFIGYFGINTIWNFPASFAVPTWPSIFLILVAFAPTIADTLIVVINRRKRGVSIMQGGKDHTTHHLAYKGHSDFKVWVIFLLLSVCGTIYTIILAYLILKGHFYLSLLGLAFFLIVFLPLYRNTRKNKID